MALNDPSAAARTVAPLLHSITETQRMLAGCGRTTVYQLIHSGRLTAVKIGRRTGITDASIRRLVAEQEERAA
jgi:hypothetical protein